MGVLSAHPVLRRSKCAGPSFLPGGVVSSDYRTTLKESRIGFGGRQDESRVKDVQNDDFVFTFKKKGLSCCFALQILLMGKHN